MSDDATLILLDRLVEGQDRAVDRLADVAKSVATLAETTASGFGEVKAECEGQRVELQNNTKTLANHIDYEAGKFDSLQDDIKTVHKRITDGIGSGKSTKVKVAQWSVVGTVAASAVTALFAYFKGG